MGFQPEPIRKQCLHHRLSFSFSDRPRSLRGDVETLILSRIHCLDVCPRSAFDQFLREHTYVYNVTPKTRDWYQSAWLAFKQS
jgi:hypothetical protein